MAHGYFAKVQYLAWFDFLSFFIVFGPALLIFLAARGVDPQHKTNTILLTPFKSNGTKITKVEHTLIYRADRNMTPTELKIMERVRSGCGRHYIRTFVTRWNKGYLVNWAFGFLIFAILAPPLSALLFLMLVPGYSLFTRLYPLIHLIFQLASVSCCLLGNYILSKSELCFLNRVWEDFPLQIILPMLSALICATYKAYEIQVLVQFCKEHLEEWETEEIIQKSNVDEVERIVKQLEALDKEGEKRHGGQDRALDKADGDDDGVGEGEREREREGRGGGRAEKLMLVLARSSTHIGFGHEHGQHHGQHGQLHGHRKESKDDDGVNKRHVIEK